MKNLLTIKGHVPSRKGAVQLSKDTKFIINGVPLHGVTAADVIYRVDEPVRATLELLPVQKDVEGIVPTIKMKHPETGVMGELVLIVFADGTDWQPRA